MYLYIYMIWIFLQMLILYFMREKYFFSYNYIIRIYYVINNNINKLLTKLQLTDYVTFFKHLTKYLFIFILSFSYSESEATFFLIAGNSASYFCLTFCADFFIDKNTDCLLLDISLSIDWKFISETKALADNLIRRLEYKSTQNMLTSF